MGPVLWGPVFPQRRNTLIPWVPGYPCSENHLTLWKTWPAFCPVLCFHSSFPLEQCWDLGSSPANASSFLLSSPLWPLACKSLFLFFFNWLVSGLICLVPVALSRYLWNERVWWTLYPRTQNYWVFLFFSSWVKKLNIYLPYFIDEELKVQRS